MSDVISAIVPVLIVILVMIQVIARRLRISMSGTEELSRYAYVIFAFLAWPVAALNGSDVAVTFIFDKLPKKKLVHNLLKCYSMHKLEHLLWNSCL